MPSIVVVGGGFAGLNAALAAVRAGNGKVDVSLVSREPWLTIRPRLYEAQPEGLRVDLRVPLSKVGARYIEGEAIELVDGALRLGSGVRVAYDRVVVATGSIMKRPPIPGADCTHSIDDWAAAMAFDASLASVSALRPPRVVVVGAGFTGIELALELRDRIEFHAGYDAANRAEIFLVDAATCIGPELGSAPRPVIERALTDARVDIRLGKAASEIASNKVSFGDGENIACDIVVLCTGPVAAPFISTIAGEKDAFGRLKVDAFLRAKACPEVYAAGDACVASPEPGRETLMSCQHALTLGKFAGENASRDLLGDPLLEYSQPRYVTCLAMGRSGALFSEGWDRVPKLVGEQAKAIKTEINTRRIYPPDGDRQEILDAVRIV
ncbi:MAG: FAD-dependent oxidoreductase [Rhodoblastus sp.]